MLLVLLTIIRTIGEILLYWWLKISSPSAPKSAVQHWVFKLRNATNYEDWEEAAITLDDLFGLDIWRNNPNSKDYDYHLINRRLNLLNSARQKGDLFALLNCLRTGLVRNLGNIASPKLFNHCFAGTKTLIEEYILQYIEALREVAELPPPGGEPEGNVRPTSEYEDGETSGGNAGVDSAETTSKNAVIAAAARERLREGGLATARMSQQNKINLMHDSRQAYGRTALVLQGGAIFGLCHLGVVKALLQRGLLPRVIVGTATGAMMAALVGVHPEQDLHEILTGDGIDLSAFANRSYDPDKHNQKVMQSMWTRLATLIRRVRRFRREGYFLDVKVLEECVRANIGDLTFEEAYHRSKRALNITVVTAGGQGIPTLLNYVTAPNVLVWTAAVASNASSSTFYGHRQTKILCKDARGNIVPWAPTSTVDFHHWTLASYTERNAPLQRVANLFNVNHYIVSQARPYLIPFLRSDMHGPSSLGKRNKLNSAKAFALRMVGLEVRHRLRQADRFGLLPLFIRRFLVDEHLPGASVTLVPHISLRDFVRLLETPTKETLEYWILRGERSVWPAVAALKVRCAIEMEYDRAYQDVRRHKARDLRRRASELEALKERERVKARGLVAATTRKAKVDKLAGGGGNPE
ncbi:hypothetical protein VTI74DRAFT_10646 [Chaetomium olivicolor]